MTILCPTEFADAVRFASQADAALEAAISNCKNPEERRKLEDKRGQGVRTLLQCFGWRAKADAMDTSNPNMLDSTVVRWPDGGERTFASLPESGRPVRDTFVFADWSKHSFFFREEWLDPCTRQRVELYDWCWYVFRGEMASKDVYSIPDCELPGLVGKSVVQTFDRAYAHSLVLKDGPPVVVRNVRKNRAGMCGGIIYHADYIDGERAGFGSWETHT